MTTMVRESSNQMNTQNIKTKERINMNEPFSIKSNMGESQIDTYLTKKQVCQKYNISHMTLESWKKEGLKYYKLGKSRTHMVKYKKKHLDDFIERHLVTN